MLLLARIFGAIKVAGEGFGPFGSFLWVYSISSDRSRHAEAANNKSTHLILHIVPKNTIVYAVR